jgi:hypothetical protein
MIVFIYFHTDFLFSQALKSLWLIRYMNYNILFRYIYIYIYILTVLCNSLI